jgi:thymidylate synthase ThyX
MIEAKVIADSVNYHGERIITIETTAPKFLDAQIEKHRMISKNSSSDRAIPTSRLVDEGNFFFPKDVRKNQRGMQGEEQLGAEEYQDFMDDLLAHFDNTIDFVKKWSGIVHKQTLNRYLLPFIYQKKIWTATEWDNFFELRLADDAQPEINLLANRMKIAIDESSPKYLDYGAWHLPYVHDDEKPKENIANLIKCSVARCARVSYNNHDGSKADIEKDLALYDFLVSSKHLTPLEHQATPISEFTKTDYLGKNNEHWCANFRGWTQWRKIVENML